eukprot:6691432-Prymnesium_polylepis.1
MRWTTRRWRQRCGSTSPALPEDPGGSRLLEPQLQDPGAGSKPWSEGDFGCRPGAGLQGLEPAPGGH